MNKSTIDQCSLLELPKIHNKAGNITPIEGATNIPFDIKRVYYLYDIPGGYFTALTPYSPISEKQILLIEENKTLLMV